MERAKIVQSGRSQAVRLPKEFRFNGSEVFVKRVGNAYPWTTRGTRWRNHWTYFQMILWSSVSNQRAKSEDKERNQAALQAFLLPLEIDFSLDETVVYGNVRVERERRGQPIGPLDTMIAAHALSLNVPLVTNNTKAFERVRGLRVEDWTN